MRHVDVNNVFLNGDLEEDVYMKRPNGFVHLEFSHRVFKFKKPLYRLKQASRACLLKLSNYLQQCGFVNTKLDTSLFVLAEEVDITILFVFFDDIIITDNNQFKCNMLLLHCMINFLSGLLHLFVVIEVHHGESGLYLNLVKIYIWLA